MRFRTVNPFRLLVPLTCLTSRRSISFKTIRMSFSTTIPAKMRAFGVYEHGDSSAIKEITLDVPKPGKDEVLVKLEYAGVNFIDTYHRKGVYPNQTGWPLILGTEGAGEVVQLPTDSGVIDDPWYRSNNLQVGSKVVVLGRSYAEYAAVPWKRVVPLPVSIPTRIAAASFTQGLTALTFIVEAYPVKAGDWILLHTAAGGLGLFFTQLLASVGAKVIGTTSSEEKARIAREHGATEMIIYTKEDTVARVLEITKGEGVSAVFDGVGKDTWENNFKLIRRKGTIVSVGNSSGVVPPFPPLKLMEKNLKVCRPTLFNYLVTQEEVQKYTSELWDLIGTGKLKVNIHKEYPFTEDGIRATHDDIVGRGTIGKLLVKIE